MTWEWRGTQSPESDTFVRTILDAMPNAVLFVDRDGRLLYANESARKLTGISGAADASGSWLAGDTSFRPGREPQDDGELLLRAASAPEGIHVSYSCRPIEDARGELLGGVLVLRRPSTPESKRPAEQRSYDDLLDFYHKAPCGFHATAADGTIVDMNDTELAWLGYSRDELVGKMKITDLLTPSDADDFHAKLPHLIETGTVRDIAIEMVRKDGSLLQVLGNATAKRDSSGRFVSSRAAFVDMTEARAAEGRIRGLNEELGRRLGELLRVNAELRSSEALLHGLFEAAGDGILLCSRDGTIALVSARLNSMFGYAERELHGRSVDELLPASLRALHAEHRAGYSADPRTRSMGGGGDLHGRRKDGTEFPVDISLGHLMTPEGIRVICIVRDVTDRTQAAEALRATEQQLRHAQKIEAIGQLAGGVAHDFNNLLSVVLCYTELLAEELPPGDAMRADLGEIRRAGERARDLTRQLLAFGRRQILAPVATDLNVTVARCHGMLRPLVGEAVDLVVIPGPEAGRILVDAGQIDQVIINLVLNARDAMPDGGTVTIEIRDAHLDADDVAEREGAPAGTYTMLAIRDTGEGMDETTRARIFEPFFTTKEQGRGTGLGLSTVFGIVKQSGGHIRVDSAPGRGSAFMLYFPQTEQEVPMPTRAPPRMRVPVGSETILVVEDDHQVRAVTRSILERRGYRVLEAGGPAEAITLSKGHQGTIHLLLTDVVMPQMNGRVLASLLVAGRPDLRVLYMSGYAHDVIADRVPDPLFTFLQKPFTADHLAQCVREALGPSGA